MYCDLAPSPKRYLTVPTTNKWCVYVVCVSVAWGELVHFFSFFLPAGAPIALAPLLVLIEIVSYIFRAMKKINQGWPIIARFSKTLLTTEIPSSGKVNAGPLSYILFYLI